ncbi:hypothetical protein JYK21_09295 [Ralstonia pickettii]|nr:hypothetical protein [Ralstonia pickettii]
METKKGNPIGMILGGALGGMAAALFTQWCDRKAGQPSVFDKVKGFESKLYADGEKRAHTFKVIKQQAETAAEDEKSVIQ